MFSFCFEIMGDKILGFFIEIVDQTVLLIWTLILKSEFKKFHIQNHTTTVFVNQVCMT